MRLAELDDPVALAVSALAVYRITRLVTTDRVADRWRAPLVARGGRAGYFVTCPWCVSVWLAAAWLPLLLLAPRVALAAGAVLAFSAVAGLLSSWE